MNGLLRQYVAGKPRILAMAFRDLLYRIHGMLHETVTIQTLQGRLTMSTHDDGIAALLFRLRQYEYESSVRTVTFLKQAGFIPADKADMIDAGANIGLISIGLSLAGHIDRAVAIEPEPHNFELLCRNTQQNGLGQRIACIQAALGENTGTLDMELSSRNRGDHRIREAAAPGAIESQRESERRLIQVQALPLPRVLELPEARQIGVTSPSFLWIDVQGYEGHVFKGGGRLLQNGLPTVSEVWPYGILRAGMSLDTFAGIVAGIWSDYWVERRGRFTRYPIAVFDRYLDEIGTEGHFENVVFTKR